MRVFQSSICAGLLLLLPWLVSFGPQTLKSQKRFKTQVQEPSDLCMNAAGNGFFVVSDNGYLAETNLEGKILRKADFTGTDFEGICRIGDTLCVVDERSREVHFFDATTLKRIKTLEVPYPGGRNKGFEAICFHPEARSWYLFTEKDPTWAFVFDSQFHKTDKIRLKGFPDISAAAFFEGKLWLLSDEAHRLYRLSPHDYSIEKYWNLPIINPEGLCFSQSGELYIASDDMGVIFQFDSRPLLP